MCSSLPKVLHGICGRPMLDYVLESASALTGNIVVVAGHGATLVKEACGPQWRYVVQKEQRGTGHAVMTALGELPQSGRLLVLCGDTPLLQSAHLRQLLEAHGENGVTMITARLPDPSGYGRVVRNSDGSVALVVEEKDASPAQKEINEINTGTYCFEIEPLRRFLPLLQANNAQGEFYLTDIIALARQAGCKAGAWLLDDYRSGLGINDRLQLAGATEQLRARINQLLMLQGVTIIDPQSTYIDHGVRVAPDTVILPQTIIEGKTEIGPSCRIGPGVHLRDSRLEEGVIVRNSVVEESLLEAGARVGPFAYIRPGCRIGRQVRIGDFVEIKNSVIGDGAKVPHLSYVGDADIGSRVNLGAGVILVNYDGRRKHRTTIEEGAFIGCNSNLISPVKIGAGSYVGAGSTINIDVPPGDLALARAKQVNRTGLAARFLKDSPAGQKNSSLSPREGES